MSSLLVYITVHHIFKATHQKEMAQKHHWDSNKAAAKVLPGRTCHLIKVCLNLIFGGLYLSPHQFEALCEEVNGKTKQDSNISCVLQEFVQVCVYHLFLSSLSISEESMNNFPV